MALRIISGVPGSGKTYFAVKHLVDKYCQLDGDSYKLKTTRVLIVSNIDSLKLPHVSLDDLVNRHGLKKVFSIDYNKALLSQYSSVIYVIDEAQRYFHRRYYDKDVFYFFQYHRHLGIDIYLIVQDFRSLPREIRSLAEYEIKALRRSSSILGEFRYNYCVGSDVIDKKVFKPNKSIFALYSSMMATELEAPKRSPFIKYLPLFFFPVFLFAYLFYSSFISPYRHSHSSSSVVSASTSSLSSSPSSPSTSFPSSPSTSSPPSPSTPQEALVNKVMVYCSVKVDGFCVLFTDLHFRSYKPQLVYSNPDRFLIVPSLYAWLHSPSPSSSDSSDDVSSSSSSISHRDSSPVTRVVSYHVEYTSGGAQCVEGPGLK